MLVYLFDLLVLARLVILGEGGEDGHAQDFNLVLGETIEKEGVTLGSIVESRMIIAEAPFSLVLERNKDKGFFDIGEVATRRRIRRTERASENIECTELIATPVSFHFYYSFL